jgi:hypothetical protein
MAAVPVQKSPPAVPRMEKPAAPSPGHLSDDQLFDIFDKDEDENDRLFKFEMRWY